jgi:hypothetical protein
VLIAEDGYGIELACPHQPIITRSR